MQVGGGDAGPGGDVQRAPGCTSTLYRRSLCSNPLFVSLCSVFNLGYREMAANWMYSLSRFAGVKEALLFAFDEDSLEECLALGFLCYDGSVFYPEDIPPHQPKAYYPGDQEWYRVRFLPPVMFRVRFFLTLMKCVLGVLL